MDEYIVSARKYRPMTFDSVVGQEALTTTLKNAVKSGKLAHAYLFCGPRGVGKTTCARIFARAINCDHPTTEGEACAECESCKAFAEQRSYNIFELDAASNNSVENIKSLMDQTRIPPQVGKYKVFIIDEVHMLSTQAFNAFLKTLEEPPAHVIFILATTEKHKILPTILSRCQIYDFERMSVPNIVNHLKMVAEKEGIQYEEEALAVIAEKADGGMRDALSIFDQTASFSQGNVTYQKVIEDLNVLDSEVYFRIVDMAVDNRVSDIMLLLNSTINKGFDGGLLINGLASHVRNVLMAKDAQTLPLLEVSEQQRQRYQEQAQKCPTPFLYNALQVMNQCDINYRQSSNKRLLVELTLIQMAQLTQPEDEPAAGRSPKRLKSLFRKIILQRQPKPTAQGVGADASAATAKAITRPLPADATQQIPNSSPQEPLPTHGGGRQEAIRLASLGMSFSNLIKQEQEKPVYYQEPVVENKGEQTVFTQLDLSRIWLAMCNRMMKLPKMHGIASRMKSVSPIITDYPQVEITVESSMMYEEMRAISRRIRVTLANDLHNSDIQFLVKLAPQNQVKPKLTRVEYYRKLISDNAAVANLTRALTLDLA